MKVLRIAAATFALLLVVAAGFVWFTSPSPGEGRILVPAKTPFTHGAYFAYAQPWGGERGRVTRWWAPHADAIAIDLKKFPDRTVTYWRWPPFTPRNGPGVWSYQAVMHGNYDGGDPETDIPIARVQDVREFSQQFAWTIDSSRGEANVLTEFYLRSSPTDPDAKLLEIGWFLHMPARSRRFFEDADEIGVFVDPQRRRWMARIEGKFLMFAPEQPGDIRKGTLDMRAALTWLQQQGRISGKEWLWGVALGSEAIRGRGSLSIEHWSVTRR